MNNKGKVKVVFIIIAIITLFITGIILNFTNIKEGKVFADDKKAHNVEYNKKESLPFGKEVKNIENNQEFWNYLKSNHPETYDLLNNLKNKDPKMYKKLVKKFGVMYLQISKSDNQELKNVVTDQINEETKLAKLTIDYKEGKIKEEEFDKQARPIISTIHDNVAKIMEIKLKEFVAKKEEKVESMLKRIKEMVKEDIKKMESNKSQETKK